MREFALEAALEGSESMQDLDVISDRAVIGFAAATDYAFDLLGGYSFPLALGDGVYSAEVADIRHVPPQTRVISVAHDVPMFRDAMVLSVPQDLEWPGDHTNEKQWAHSAKLHLDLVRTARPTRRNRQPSYDYIASMSLATGQRIIPRHFEEIVINAKIDNAPFEVKIIGSPDYDLVAESDPEYTELLLLVRQGKVSALALNGHELVYPDLTRSYQQPLLAQAHLALSQVLVGIDHGVDMEPEAS